MALDNLDRDQVSLWCGYCEEYIPLDEYQNRHQQHDDKTDPDRTPPPR